MNYLG
jgi:hypothetical protein